jgi:hypothetical protein
VVLHPEALPFGEPINGLEIMSSAASTPGRGFLEEAGCAECRREVGERCSKAWKSGRRPHRQLHLPVVRHEDDINGFLYLQECAFSNLGFIFNNWLEAGFKQSFIDEFADWLDQPVSWVKVGT